MDGNIQYDPTQNVAIRQLRGTTESRACGICSELVCNDVIGHLQLGCSCVVHYTCLVRYIRSISRLTISKDCGIVCPYWVTGECKMRDSKFFMRPTDFSLLVEYYNNHSSHVTEDISVPMTAEEVDKIISWTTEVAVVQSTEEAMSLYALETTKPCPKCKYRVSHFSGHGCHHVMVRLSYC